MRGTFSKLREAKDPLLRISGMILMLFAIFSLLVECSLYLFIIIALSRLNEDYYLALLL